MGKFKLTVVFGREACDYADAYGTRETVKALERGEFEGMARTYELDTREDAEQLAKALEDAWGWDSSFYDVELGENGIQMKFDD